MKNNITPEEIAKIEKDLNNSCLDECSKDTIKGLIAGQSLLLHLIEKLIASSGHQRSKVIQELAKILDITLNKKCCNPPENASKDDSSSSNSAGKDDLLDSSSADLSPKDEELSGEESQGNNEKGDEKEAKDSPKKKHPKRKNDEFNPVASHLHHHENLEPGDECPACLKGKVYPFREKVIPVLIGRSPFAYEEHRLQTLRCNTCGALFEPKLPKEIPRIGNSTPSAQAVLTLLHYKIGIPFASASDFQAMFDQDVSPAQLWDVIKQAARAIKPIYQELEREAANSRLFYTDDTSARILSYYSVNKKNREKKGRSKNPQDRVGTYSTLIVGCTTHSHEVYLFYHGRKYAGENLADLLINRDEFLEVPIQMKDASTMNVPPGTKVIEAKCNAHAIRKFKDLKEIYPKWCDEVLRNYSHINKIDQMLLEKEVNDRDRLAYHKTHSLPLMEEIKSYLQGVIGNKIIEPNSSLGGAIAYFLSHYQDLTAFCRIEGAPFDNNLAERGLKMIIRLRKVSMFYKTEHGAKIAGMLQSVLYTAQEAGVNVLTYLQSILENPEEARKNPSAFLPWTFQNSIEITKTNSSLELSSL